MEWNFKIKTILFLEIFFLIGRLLGNSRTDVTLLFPLFSYGQEEVARLASLQPQVDLLEKRLQELKEEKEGEEEPPAFLDADIDAFEEHYRKVLEDLRARERQLQLGERRCRSVNLSISCSSLMLR